MLSDVGGFAEDYYPPRDLAGAIIPHKLELPLFLRALGPGFVAFFDKTVPGEFWAEEMDGEVPKIVVACPCGGEPTLRFLTRSFSLAECDCDRIFMHDGKEVRVGRLDEASEEKVAPAPSA